MSEFEEKSGELSSQDKVVPELDSTEEVQFSETGDPAWRKWVYLLFIVLVVSSAILLLAMGETRQHLITAVAEQWMQFFPNPTVPTIESAEIFVLPPPPPKPVVPKFVISSVPVSIVEEPILYAERGKPGGRREEKEAQVAPVETAQSRRAYDLLLEWSQVVRKLIANEYAEYPFKEWKLIRSNPPEFLIEFVAVRREDGKEIHFIWSVDTQQVKIRALSQAARDLEQQESG